MAKVIWLGEDDLHNEDQHGGSSAPRFTTWNGVKFAKGVAVEVTNETAVAKARGNPFFKVEDDKVKSHDDKNKNRFNQPSPE